MSTPQQSNPPNPKPVIGLTGGPGSGKSTIAGLFAELGCAVIDADRLAHDALLEQAVKSQVREKWGEAVFDEAGQVNRPALGKVVFRDPVALKALEEIVHPRVHAGRQLERAQHQANPQMVAIVEDCPLLLESHLNQDCDAVVFIDTPDELRLERVRSSRGWTLEELKKRDLQQMPLDIKREQADYVLSNDRDLAHVREQVRNVLQSIINIEPS
ncbi:MAG: dephospho-CoA kinase [Planctomycetota bacterium]